MMEHKQLRMLTREAYDLWQYFKREIEADPKIKRRMRSKKVQRLFKLEHKTHWRWLRRALDLDRLSKLESAAGDD